MNLSCAPIAAKEIFADPASPPIIVVGAGPAGVRFVELFLARNREQQIALFGDEPWEPYNRVKLSSLLAGEISLSQVHHQIRIPDSSRLVKHFGCAVTSVCRETRHVTDHLGRKHRYAALVLAVGSRPHVPAVAGVELPGVFRFRDLNDTASLLARTARSRHTVVVGGGLLGIEGARALLRAGTRITVVQQPDRLMNRQLDAQASAILETKLTQLGIEVIKGQRIGEVVGSDRVEGVKLRFGDMITCDTVLFATGIRPNIELATTSGLSIGQGIRINNALQTSDPAIYAIGECAEHEGKIFGLVSPGMEQAAVLADRLCGGSAQYQGTISGTHLKVLDEAVFSAGDVTDLPQRAAQREFVWSGAQDQYRKIVLHHRDLIGALAIGDYPERHRVHEAIAGKRKIGFFSLLRFRFTGNLWASVDDANILDWPSETIVCRCMSVSKGTLTESLAYCATMREISERTGAGTVCGSCKPMLQQLTGATEKAEPAEGFAPLIVFGLVATLALAAMVALPALQTATSFADRSWLEPIWNDGLFKQITGYTALGLSVATLLLSARKRIAKIVLGKFATWRIVHVALGLFAALLILLHTGLHIGSNLNRWLLTNFLILLLLGAYTAVVIGTEHKLAPHIAKRSRRYAVWAHILLCWPFPALLSFHILSVYFF